VIADCGRPVTAGWAIHSKVYENRTPTLTFDGTNGEVADFAITYSASKITAGIVVDSDI
jgi:hypothetical protein